jgi:hypothetical protein
MFFAFVMLAELLWGGGAPTTPRAPQIAKSQEMPAAPPVAKAAQSDAPAIPTSGWVYQRSKDEMRGTTSKFAVLKSSNFLIFGFPYKGGAARLALRQRPEDGLNVILTIDGQFLCSQFTNDTVAVKFDDGPIRRFECSRPKEESSGSIFINDEQTFLSRLRKAKKVIIEADFYREGPKQMVFNVGGLDWK